MSRIPSLLMVGALAAAAAACGGGSKSTFGVETPAASGATSSAAAGGSFNTSSAPTAAGSAGASAGASAGSSSAPSAGSSAEASAGTSAAPSGSPAASPGASSEPSLVAGPQITVTAVDYQFTGMPTSVPVGTTLNLQNNGTEVHEMVIVRKNDGVTQPFEELLQLPEDQVPQYITVVGQTMAAPGDAAGAGLQVTQEGDYLVLCFIPQGTYSMPPIASGEPTASGEPGMSAEPSTEASMAAASPAASGLESPGASMGIPHFMLGMMQEFQVTAAGSTPGPIPTAAPSMSPGASMDTGASMEPGESESPEASGGS